MAQVILVYALCEHPSAKGDYVLAGGIAKDLVVELEQQGSDIQVILTSQQTAMTIYYSFYGPPLDERITIDGVNIKLISLEQFDGVANHVVAFIDANHCQHPPVELVKRVLSLDSKILLVGAANRPYLGEGTIRDRFVAILSEKHPGLYTYFPSEQIEVLRCGFGTVKIGFPTGRKAIELPDAEESKVPSLPYGFIYPFNDEVSGFEQLSCSIGQYMQLTGCSQYLLVGGLIKARQSIEAGIEKFNQSISQEMSSTRSPQIIYYAELNSLTMRYLKSKAVLLLFLTGTMSPLQAMHDGHLIFYHLLEHTRVFALSYLYTLRAMLACDEDMFGSLKDQLIALSELLFAHKPLPEISMGRLSKLLGNEEVTKQLIITNQNMVEQASGGLASKLLSFLGKPVAMSVQEKCEKACRFLRKPDEQSSPLLQEALMRASAWGYPFELRILLSNMTPEQCSRQSGEKQFSALHCAVSAGHLDCVRLLIGHGVTVDLEDKDGRTPFNHADALGRKDMIALLVDSRKILTGLC